MKGNKKKKEKESEKENEEQARLIEQAKNRQIKSHYGFNKPIMPPVIRTY